MKIRFTEINWDLSDIEPDGMAPNLPKETVLETPLGELEENDVSNLLSDHFGFLVNTCRYEVLKED